MWVLTGFPVVLSLVTGGRGLGGPTAECRFVFFALCALVPVRNLELKPSEV